MKDGGKIKKRLNISRLKTLKTFKYQEQERSSMTEDVTVKKPVAMWKVKVLSGLAAGSALVAGASADVDLNATISPILDSIIELIPSIIDLIVAIVPAIIVMAVVGFIVAFFDKILGMMKL
jgi:hypothetical protein